MERKQLSARQQEILDFILDNGRPIGAIRRRSARSASRSGSAHRRRSTAIFRRWSRPGTCVVIPASHVPSRSSTRAKTSGRCTGPRFVTCRWSAASPPARRSSPKRTSTRSIRCQSNWSATIRCSCCEVKGDSMIDVGIFDGDYVVIRRQSHAGDGAIVAALIDGEEATVKRLQRFDGRVVLKAENPAFPPMVFSDGRRDPRRRRRPDATGQLRPHRRTRCSAGPSIQAPSSLRSTCSIATPESHRHRGAHIALLMAAKGRGRRSRAAGQRLANAPLPDPQLDPIRARDSWQTRRWFPRGTDPPLYQRTHRRYLSHRGSDTHWMACGLPISTVWNSIPSTEIPPPPPGRTKQSRGPCHPR